MFFFVCILLAHLQLSGMEKLLHITTNDKKKYCVPAHLLSECTTLRAIDDPLNMGEYTFNIISASEWKAFRSCLKDQTNADDDQQELVDLVEKEVTSKKRARDVLCVAHFLGHDPLVKTTAQLWADRAYDVPDYEMIDNQPFYDVPEDAQDIIAQAVVDGTLLKKKLPKWVFKRTPLAMSTRTIEKSPWAISVSATSSLFAIGDGDGKVHVFDQKANTSSSFQAHPHGIRDLHFAHNDTLITTAADGSVRVWNAQTKDQISILPLQDMDGPTLIDVCAATHLVAVHDITGIVLWNYETDDKIIVPHISAAQSTTALSTTKGLVAGDDHNLVRVWNITNGALVSEQTTVKTTASKLIFNADCSQLAAGCKNGTIYIWSTRDYQTIAILPAHKRRIWSLVFSECGRFLISCSIDKTLKVWDLVTQKVIKELQFESAIHDMRLMKKQLIVALHQRKYLWIDLAQIFEAYENHLYFFENSIHLSQALLVQKALKKHRLEPLYLSNEEKDTFNSLPLAVSSMLKDELHIKTTAKKRKTADEKDEDYEPEADDQPISDD